MRIVPIEIWNQQPIIVNENVVVARLENPVLAKVMAERRSLLQRSPDQDFYYLEKFALESRVLIVEGISGSGKDTFQTYLQKMINGRDVYDYSEGEVLHSWKQLQIEGISKLRVQLMKLFVNHMSHIVNRDDNAVFLLNRFHLSTYASTIIQHPELEKDYDEIIKVLRNLPVHIFILQLEQSEIEKRSFHPERSGPWQKFQQQIVDNHSFHDRLERQQKTIIETAKRQQIPYSLIKLADEHELGNGRVRISKSPSIRRGHGGRLNGPDGTSTRRKRDIPPNL